MYLELTIVRLGCDVGICDDADAEGIAMDDVTLVESFDSGEQAADFHESIVGIDHIAAAVADIAEAISWYSRTLGFSLIETRTTKGVRTSMVSAVMKAGGAVVVLVQGVEPDSQVSQFVSKFGPGVQHVAFSVSDLDKALADVVRAGGVSETGILQDVGIRQTFLRRDPGSAVRVELIERNGGEFSDSSVERLFKSMEALDIY